MGSAIRRISTLRNVARKSPTQGFTLLELLVSITLMGLLAVAIHFGFRIGSNAWAKGNDGLQDLRIIHSTLDLMSRQVSSMVAYYSQQKIKDGPVDILVYQGMEQGMRFVTTFSAQARSAGGLRLVEYFLTSSRDKKKLALVMNETTLPDDTGLGQFVFRGFSQVENNNLVAHFFDFRARPDSIYLFDDLDQAKFHYFERRMSSEKPAIADSGNEKPHLPRGVGIQLRWNENGLFSTRDFSIVVPVQVAL